MAGPWFTVHRSGDDWQEMGKLWISDGAHDWKGRIEIRIELVEAGEFDLLFENGPLDPNFDPVTGE